MAGKPIAREARRRALRRAALDLLGEAGYHGFTMREVARRTRQTVANVYHHVADKEDLVHAALAERLDAAVASAEAALAVRGARERLRALATDHVSRLVDAPAEASAWRGEWPPLRESQRRRLTQSRERYEGILRGLVDDLVGRRGEKRAASERRCALLLALLERVAAMVERSASPARVARAANEALALFLDGALPRARAR